MSIETLANFVIKKRLIVILSAIGLLLLCLVLILRLPIKHDNSFEMFMLPGDPNIERFEKFRDLFGDAEYLVIGLEKETKDKDIFDSETIKVIHEISEMLEYHEHVTKVSSLSNYQYFQNSNGIISTKDLFSDLNSSATTASELESARKAILKDKIAKESLITPDLNHTRILARTEYIENENYHKIRVAKDLYKFINENKYLEKGYHIHLGGSAILAERFETFSKQDSSLLNPLVALIMVLILYLIFGSILVCFLPWLLIATSLIIVKAAQAVLSIPITVVNSALIPTLMIIGMGVSIHLLTEFFSFRKDGFEPSNSAKNTLTTLFKPLLFTALTTSTGFLALAITELTPVRHYAFLASFGSMVIFAISTTFFVGTLSFISYFPSAQKNISISQVIERYTTQLNLFCFAKKKHIAVLSVFLLLYCFLTVPRITADSNIFNYFKADSWIYQDMIYFDKHYKVGGIEIIVDSGEEDGIKVPNFLTRVEALETRLSEFEQIGKVTSAVNFLKSLRRALSDDREEFYKIPETSDMTAQLLLMYSNSGPNDDLSDSIDFENRFLRVSVPVENMTARQFSIFYRDLQHDIKENFPDLILEYTGPLVIYNAQEFYINNGLKKSFSLALLVISLTFFILFKSVKYGIIALFPSVLPILTVGGSSWLMGMTLDLGTIIVGAMCMGIAVDDAIHVMNRYLYEKENGSNTSKSLDKALRSSGKAVIFTSIILVFGFTAMFFASLVPTILFGIFVSMILLLALIGDIYILPALLHIFD